MNSLWWKQWHENKGCFVLFMSWMMLAVCYCIGYELGYRFRAPVGHFSVLAWFYSMCAAVFLAMRTAKGEQADGTLSFTASLPVTMRRVATVRVAGAVALLVTPVLVAAVVLSLALATGLVEQAAPRGGQAVRRLTERDAASLFTALEQLWSVAAIAILGGAQYLLLLSLFGCWVRTQARIGLLGAVMGFGSLVASGLFWYGERRPYLQLAYGAVFPQSLVVHWGFGAEHGGYTDHELTPFRWIALCLAIPLLVIIARLFVTQYGFLRDSASATAKPRRFRFITPPLWSHIPVPLPSRWLALIWFELRQSLPLVLSGLLLALLMTVASVVIEPRDEYSTAELFRADMPHSIAILGMLWAVVVGSGLYAAELGSGLGGFWRSRPISSGMWFWCKFVVGLLAVLGVLDGVTILISWDAPRELPTEGMSWAYLACFPIIHALMYALSVLGTCWLRRPVIGGFLALFGYTVLTIAITTFPMTDHLEPFNVYNDLLQAERAGQVDFTQHGYPLVYGVLLASVFLCGLLAFRFAKPLEPIPRWFHLTAA
jgi:hypothetical protein